MELTANTAEVSSLLSDIANNGSKLTSGDSTARKALLTASRELYLKLETPIEKVLRWEWAEPALNGALRVAVDIKLFDALVQGGGRPKTGEELASLTGIDSQLLGRILRHLASMRVIQEVDADIFTSTPVSKALVEPKYRDGIPLFFDVTIPAMMSLPKFLASTGYKNPLDPNQNAFKVAHNTQQNAFDWLGEHPEVFALFNNHMEAKNIGRAKWTDPGCVDVEEMLGRNAERGSDSVLLVDVGGGMGMDIAEFHRRFSHLPGRLVLQDLPPVVKNAANLPAKVEVMGHDFFMPQPIQGARAYYLHTILHDWPDIKCLEILSSITPAMKRGYSKLLIQENVIPHRDADWCMTALDMLLMASFGGCERTEQAWRKLLGDAGLKVVRIWDYERGWEGLIECELA